MFVEKFNMVEVEFVFVNSGPPTKSPYGPEVEQQTWC